MAFKKKSQPKHKSKGGGGKKARIAAQRRDRYWGEDVEETEQVIRRPGEGRQGKVPHPIGSNQVTSQSSAKWKSSSRVEDVRDRRTVDSDDESDNESVNVDSTSAPHHFSKLMESLSSKRRTSRNTDASDDDESVESRSSQGPAVAQDSNGDLDNYKGLPSLHASAFADHFSREPVVDAEILAMLQELQKNTKGIVMDDAALEVQVSRKLVPTLQVDWNDESSTPEQGSTTNRQTVHRRARQYMQSTEPMAASGIKVVTQNLVASALVPTLRTYADVLVTTDSDPTLGTSNSTAASNANAIHTALGWHIVQHVQQSRSAIDHNNRRLRRAADKENAIDTIDTEWCRDQGFTRPTVLVLLPTRHCCHDFVTLLLSLVHGTATEAAANRDAVQNMDRFDEEYGPASVAPQDSEGADEDRRRRDVLRHKGPDWNDLFGDDRNDDDDFKIGLQFNWKRHSDKDQRHAGFSGKLYSDFYRSDIILASPLGLKMITQSSGDDESPDQRGSDFLSSIDICLVARADVLWHQNWDHVPDILSLVNQRPHAMNDTDFSRVRQYQLAGQSAHWRQLIISGNMSDPSILSCFKRFASSIQGVIKIKRKTTAVTDASIASVWWPNIRQVFQRVSAASFASAGDDRLKYFLDHIWPKIESSHRGHTMIFIPSYFEFCPLRNALLQKQEQPHGGGSSIDFVSVTEYSRPTEVARGRARFLQGRKPVLLYTGRAHFFLRHAIKGVRHLIFFGLPEVASFYTEHVNRLNEGLQNDAGDDVEDTSCLALFTKYDAHSLERIVGSVNCNRMIKGEKSTFLFSSS